MCALVSKCAKASAQPTPATIASMCHPKVAAQTVGIVDDEQPFAVALGKLWGMGVAVDWSRYHRNEPQLRVPLPSYCFEKLSFWKNPSKSIYVPGGPQSDESNKPAPSAPPAPAAHKALIEYSAASTKPWVKIYCFPFAGGSSLLFASWAKAAAQGTHVVAVELPGRGSRSAEPLPASDADDVAELENIAAAIQQDVADGTAYVLVGYSMGALMAVQVASLMPAAHRAPHGQLKHLVLAGRAPIGFHMPHSGAIDVEAFAMAPPEVMASEAWEEYLLPMLTADLRTDVRNEARLFNQLQPNVSLLSCPVDVFCGLEDSAFPKETVHQWAPITSSHTTYHLLPGEHSFLNDESDAIFARVARSLEVYRPHHSSTCIQESTSGTSSMMFQVVWKRISTAAVETSMGEITLLDLETSLCDQQLCTEAWIDSHKQAVASSEGLVVRLLCSNGVDTVDADTEQAWALIELTQQLVQAGASGKILLVCPASERGAMAAGASKALPLEFPEISVQRVFVPPSHFERVDCGWLCKIAAAHPTEIDLLVKPGRRAATVLAQRCEPVPVSAQPRHPVVYEESSNEPVFIVTGGLGGVGGAVVDWLIDSQQVAAHNVVILSRRAVQHPRRCRMVQVDVTDCAALLALDVWDEITHVAGVLHLAGVLDDGLLTNMSRERMANVIAPKAAVSNLVALVHEMGWAPHYVAGFSSTSSLFGYAGQSNYCAANCFMDQVSQWAQPTEVPFIALNWSAWDAGMAAKGTKAYKMSIQNGEVPINIKEGIKCLHHTLSMALGRTVRQICIADCDWAATPWDEQACIAVLKEQQQRLKAVEVSSNPNEQVDTTDDPAGGSAISKFLEQKVSKWSPSETLSDLGLDSLDMAQMRATFNKEFSKQAGMDVFADPMQTLAQLASRLQEVIDS